MLKFLAIIAIALLCGCFIKIRAAKPAGVSIATPHWCPTNVRCDEYLRDQVKRSIRRYARMDSTSDSQFKFNEQYALSILVTSSMKEDKVYHDEWLRVFKLEFTAAVPFMQLAHREDKPLDHYLK